MHLLYFVPDKAYNRPKLGVGRRARLWEQGNQTKKLQRALLGVRTSYNVFHAYTIFRTRLGL